ncbi:HNH endonuclease signature motif containing protein [Mycolicibacterium sp. F2034L]|uniref:HNH endonuclease signature motif containing protein n=1 Tax=Mycolicibacterium sp. F2034L TaxID=2926422 RepID=UPI001FF5352E|nr:HNH endonuclease signature motif containing protein [Mycolicibacterium sp. F2034L]MCK0175236.1 HNH endonuclease [Mycolicibacterium sp. F2034L]
MFDDLFFVAEDTPASRAALSAVSAASRAENRAAAARLVAVGELWSIRLRECGDRADWIVDAEAAVTAEIAAELRISQGLAASALRYAQSMQRIPKVADVFISGAIHFALFRTIVYRTDLIIDDDVLAAVDAELAVTVPGWPSMTRSRLAQRLDKIVRRHDSDAVRKSREKSADTRELWISDRFDGLSEISATVLTPHAHAFGRRLAALAATVCEHDPRTHEQRMADAVDVLTAGGDRIRCRCGRPECTAAANPPAGSVVIHVVTDGTGDSGGAEIGDDGMLPPEVIEELAPSAKTRPVISPVDEAPEPQYAPSQALAEFVRCRDMTCRFPGCDRPATTSDIDHTLPYADGGPTQASNLKCLCRLHHLLKTFWGWQDRQLTDGTVIWKSPIGQVYVTTPGSALLFPALCRPTAPIVGDASAAKPRPGGRTAMMPRRRRTRAQDRAARILTERRHHHSRHREKADHRPDYGDDPPPF